MSTTSPPPVQGWLGRLVARQSAAQSIAAPVAPADTVSEPSTPPLAFLAAALSMPHGATVEQFGAALAAHKVGADPDPELVDDLGLPVLCARSAQALDDAVRADLLEWLAASAGPDPHFSDEQWRALTLGTAIIRDLAAQAPAMLLPEAGTPPRLQLAVVLPADWLPAQRQAACLWWQHTLVAVRWPAPRLALIDTPDAMAPAALIARLAHEAAMSPTPAATILLAASSHIGQETVDRWASGKLLFTPDTPRGSVPGEGAAGLLLADARLAPEAQHAGSIDLHLAYEDCAPLSPSQKRPSPQQLNALAARVLGGGTTAPADIAMIVADTGPGSRNMLELMDFTAASAPHLDNAEDILRLGAACGACDAVPFVAALAVARQMALDGKGPLLCVGNEMPAARAVALVRHPRQA